MYDCQHDRHSDIMSRMMYEEEEQDDFDCIYDEEEFVCPQLNCGEERDAESGDESKICRVFVDGTEADFDACEDEDCLLERVWSMSKPPKIPRRTCVVPARRVQIMKECLSSTIKAKRTLCEMMHDKKIKYAKRKLIGTGMQYLKVHSFNGQTKASCQEETHHIVPECAQTLDVILAT